MSPTQKKRFIVVSLILVGVSVTTVLGLMAVDSSIDYFRTPTQIHNGEFESEQSYRIAGIVKKGSVQRLDGGITQRFVVTDCEHDVTIQYTGILPDLFREGQAIVSIGRFDQQATLIANKVLAKHDENYVPNEAADAVMLAQANKCDSAEGAISY